MTNFADQLFDDLMREHGPALARTGPAAHPRRPITTRRTLLAGGGTLAVAGAIAGTLVTGTGTPAYAVTKNPDGTITLAVHQRDRDRASQRTAPSARRRAGGRGSGRGGLPEAATARRADP